MYSISILTKKYWKSIAMDVPNENLEAGVANLDVDVTNCHLGVDNLDVAVKNL